MPAVTFEELAEVFEEFVDLSGIEINADTALGDEIPVDSREMLRALSKIESRYKIRFQPRDVLQLKNLGDLRDTVVRLANMGS